MSLGQWQKAWVRISTSTNEHVPYVRVSWRSPRKAPCPSQHTAGVCNSAVSVPPCLSDPHRPVNLQSPQGFLLTPTSCTEVVESPPECGGAWLSLVLSVCEWLLVLLI